MTRSLLNDYAHFSEDEFSFTLHRNSFAGENIHPGPYRMGKNVNEVNTYRVGHPLAQRVLDQARKIETPTCELTFEYTDSGKHILHPRSFARGKQGWLICSQFTIRAHSKRKTLYF